MTIRIDDCPTPLVDWRHGTEPDRVWTGYHYGREIRIDHAPDSGGIAVWRIRVHYGTGHVEAERIHRGTIDDCKELAAWIACDLSRRDWDTVMIAVRCGFAVLPCSLTHCAVIDGQGRQYDNVPIASVGMLCERLMGDNASRRVVDNWDAAKKAAVKAMRERAERRECASGTPLPTQYFPMGPAKEDDQ